MIPKLKPYKPLSETQADQESTMDTFGTPATQSDPRAQAVADLRKLYAEDKQAGAQPEKPDQALTQLMKKSRFLSPQQIAALLRGQGGV